MRHRFQQVGGALRTLLASPTAIYKQAVELQKAEAKEFIDSGTCLCRVS